MEQLEFALIPIGIVLGYGVTKVLGSWAHLVRIRRRLERPPILFFSATALSLFYMYANFSGLWAYSNVDFQYAAGTFNTSFLLLITLPMLLFMLAISVMVPSDIDDIQDLEGHYDGSTGPFYVIFCAAIASSALPDLLPGVRMSVPLPLTIFSWFLLLSLLTLVWFKGRLIHLSVHALQWLVLLGIFILWPLAA